MSDQKPREFWIEKSSLGIFNAVEDKAKLNGWKQDNGPIHVIEKSAYDEAEKYADRCTLELADAMKTNAQLRADLDLAIEALKWYSRSDLVMRELGVEESEVEIGGLAQETLAKLQERK